MQQAGRSLIGRMSPRYAGLLSGDSLDLANLTLLPVLNRAPVDRSRLPLRFTLCIANMFGSYNNVLQFVQVKGHQSVSPGQRSPVC